MSNEPTTAAKLGGGTRFSLNLWLMLLLAGLLGGAAGLGGFTLFYAEGYSYLLDDPDTCLNCHVMRDVYDGWNHSSHKNVAVCNDCHTPHRFPDKYVVKGLNGWRHSVAFTTGDFHEPIMIKDMNREVALENCYYCHGDMVVAIGHEGGDEPTDCLHCHAGVGHGK